MNCIFCKIIAGEIPSQMVYENDRVCAFLTLNPYNEGHTLVVPKQHAENLVESSPEDFAAVMNAVQTLAPKIIQAVGAQGFNTIINSGAASGQEIFHTHTHIIPRFENDGFARWPHKEMTQEQMDATAEKIRNYI